MSTAQKRGSNYDNEVANALQERTPDDVAAHSMRGSGNTTHPQPDVLVRRSHHDVALELKRSSVATGEYCYIDEEDLLQLAACRNEITHAYLGLKFTHRELVVVWVPQHADDPDKVVQSVAGAFPDPFDGHVTDGGNLRLTKPQTEAWPSATSGRDDVDVLADELNIELEE